MLLELQLFGLNDFLVTNIYFYDLELQHHSFHLGITSPGLLEEIPKASEVKHKI